MPRGLYCCAVAAALLTLGSPRPARAFELFFGTGSPTLALEEQREALIEKARDSDPGVRLGAIAQLRACAGMPRVAEALLDIAEGGAGVEERVAAIRSLSEVACSNPRVKDKLENLLTDREPAVRAQAVTTLAPLMRFPEWRERYTEIAADSREDVSVRLAAIGAVRAQAGFDLRVRDELIRLCEDDSQEAPVRSAACAQR